VSTNSTKFAPLQFDQTSKGYVRPGAVSTADEEAAKRRSLRDGRFQRAQKNLALSKSYCELEDLKAQMVALQRNERKTQAMLKYESHMFLEDLKLQRKQPLNSMARRPNTVQASSMWGGNGVRDLL
jgi:hypothetical protein